MLHGMTIHLHHVGTSYTYFSQLFRREWPLWMAGPGHRSVVWRPSAHACRRLKKIM